MHSANCVQALFTRRYWVNFGPSLAAEWRSSLRSFFDLGVRVGWWKMLGYPSCYAVVFVLCLFLPLYYLLGAKSFHDSLGNYDGKSPCQPDGRFTLTSNYNLWCVSGIFQISMGFGVMSFSNAKLLDVVWDVGVGRGVQGLLALVAYRVTTMNLTMAMERHAVPIGTFEAITLQDSTFVALYKQIRNFLSIKGWKQKLRLFWIILSTLFIVIFPILAGAMTGYAPVTTPFVQGDRGELNPLGSYVSAIYIVHDADRIGLQPPLVLSIIPAMEPVPFRRYQDACVMAGNMPVTITADGLVPRDWNFGNNRCLLIWHVRQYIKAYGILGLTNTTSTFNRTGEIVNLSAPTLNIQPFRGDWKKYQSYPSQLEDELFPELKRTSRSDPIRVGLSANYTYATSKSMYTVRDTNSVLDILAIEKQGSCQQTATYSWGFSFLLLFIVLIFFIVWILGTYVLWLDAYLYSRLHIAERDMGLYRAALDIASMIQSDLKIPVDDLTPNTLLQKRVGCNKNPGTRIHHLNEALLSRTRMMEFQDWGRAGGYSRWAPRFTLVLLLVAIIITPVLLAYYETGSFWYGYDGSSWTFDSRDLILMKWLMSLFGLLTLLNILILGGRTKSGPRHQSCNSDTSRHPLQSFEDDHPPSTSMMTASEISIDGTSSNESDVHHAAVGLGQPSKSHTSATAVEISRAARRGHGLGEARTEDGYAAPIAILDDSLSRHARLAWV